MAKRRDNAQKAAYPIESRFSVLCAASAGALAHNQMLLSQLKSCEQERVRARFQAGEGAR